MFFSRKKDKDEMPVVAKKPPVPPKRNKLFQLGSQKSSEDASTSLSLESTVPSTVPNSTVSHGQYPPNELDYTGNGGSLYVKDFHLQSSGDSLLTTGDYANYGEPVSPSQPHNGAAFGTLKEFDLPGLQLPALKAVQVRQRTLTLHKGVAGDFGFSIRRVQFPLGGVLKTVVFAEPSDIKEGPPRPDDIKNGLLPGDQLIEIDGKNVERMSREELQEAVRSAGNSIVLIVRSVPELAEFCDRHRGARDTGDSLLLTNVDTNAHESIPEEERYWLMHKGGYTMARLREMQSDGRVAVTVAGRDMVVDSTDVDRSNPSHMDRAPDIAALRYLNETSTVHLLRQRFGSSLSYTNAGSASLICMSGEQEPGVQERLLTLFKGCRRGQMPPHIYATAQQVYRHVQMTASPQSVLFTGVTGSGKSTQLRNFVQYMATVAGWTKTLPYSKLSCVLGILEAFTHAATHLHRDSTRCIQLVQLGFDKAAALKCAKVQCCLLESDRVVRRPEGESSFHVFYYLWEGADPSLRNRLQLECIDSPNIIPLKTVEDKEQAKEAWSRLLSAFSQLGFTNEQVEAVCSVLAAIFHLNRAEASPGAAHRSQFLRVQHAQIASSLLGLSIDTLSHAVFRGSSTTGTSHTGIGSSLSRFSLSVRGPEGPDALSSFVSSLYNELIQMITDIINRGLTANAACTWVTLVDVPGSNFNSEWTDSRKRAFGLNELVYNYVNERVAELVHDKSFAEMDEIYTREQVDVDVEKPVGSPHSLNRLIDQKQQLVNCTDLERRSEERRGLLAILEEESVFPGATDESLFERIFMHLGDENRLIRRASKPGHFVLAHGLDSHPTTYAVKGWVRQAQPSDHANTVRKALISGKGTPVQSLFTPPGVSVGDSALKLRRATQTATTEGVGRRIASGFAANMLQQMDYVFSSVRRSPRSHFIHCIQPSAPSPSMMTSSTSMMTSSITQPQTTDTVDVPFVRNQLRSVLLIDSVRANNRGYPERVSFRDFRRRFSCLVDESNGDNNKYDIDEAIDDRSAVQKIMDKMDIHSHRYRLGISQVLLRSDVLSELEDRRDLSLSGLIVAFQRESRRHLAAKWLQKRRVLEMAIKCIQKNGVAYSKVREWPWWKLYTRVVPLLPVNRTEGEYREWSERVDRLEQIVADMRGNKKVLEGRVAELEDAVGRETDKTHEMTVTLERERQARMQAERRIADEDRISRVSSVAKLELMTDDKVVELRREVEKARETEETMRVKTQRTVTRLQDVEAELNDVRARNDILEKKQNRFDADLAVVQDQVTEIRSLKERVEKERDELMTQINRRKSDSENLKSENGELRTSVSRLKRELDDIQEQSGSADTVELTSLRKAKRDLEQKTQEQEDELDDLAGQRQLLQQSVTRLEMQVERLKNDSVRESGTREAEVEELRAQYQRRLRAFEDQIADLQDGNSSLQKQNRVLEQRMRNQDAQSVTLEMSGGHYKRELRKALALLADSQCILAHERECAPNQALIRQLREQLEDAEAAKLAALKGRHSLESELNELRAQLEQVIVAKGAAEDKVMTLLKEKNSGLAIIEEKDEQLLQLMKKYKAAVQQSHIDGISIADYVEQIADLQKAKQKITEELHERSSQLDYMSQHTVEKHKLILAEQKIRDVEAKLDLEQMQKLRLESNVLKLSDEVESLNEQMAEGIVAKEREAENGRKLRKEMTLLEDSMEALRKRDADTQHKYKHERSENEKLEESMRCSQAELKLSAKRIDALQSALSDGLGDDTDRDDLSDVDEDDEMMMSNVVDENTNGMNIL